MPYCWTEGNPGLEDGEGDEDDEEHEYRPPKLSQFHYEAPYRHLPGPELVRVLEPVPFNGQVPPPLAFPLPPLGSATPGFLDLLSGRWAPAPAQTPRLTWEQRQEAERHRSQHLLALTVEALREIGVRRVYCRYDGGNDEGFAWVDHAETGSGQRLAPDLLAKRLARTSLLRRAARAQLWRRRSLLRAKELRHIADWAFASECAGRLLGPFGIGPMLLYGAFTVDLDACTIADDPNADPIVRNFQIEA